MADFHTLTVKLRDGHGKRVNRRLRNAGQVPAVLYGHKQAAKSLALSSEELDAAIRHGNRFVALAGGVSENAFIKDVQWNTWGTEVLHVDFARVSADEKVQVTVAVELRGEAPGMKDGGVVKHMLHSIELECEAASVPEKLLVNINHLEFGKILHVSDLELPRGVVALSDAVAPVVSCLAPVEVSEEEQTAGEGEPEVIGRKKEDDDDSEPAKK
ncbi:MAG: 50S ribosomal protein L25 [Planctomycetaceae bacterium]|jgi:large subunit ribosomal protein L25|nr:50S ribosomal protein L25 [Planctomycetaceae bacterium]